MQYGNVWVLNSWVVRGFITLVVLGVTHRDDLKQMAVYDILFCKKKRMEKANERALKKSILRI